VVVKKEVYSLEEAENLLHDIYMWGDENIEGCFDHEPFENIIVDMLFEPIPYTFSVTFTFDNLSEAAMFRLRF
jgi:hypothetical protein